MLLIHSKCQGAHEWIFKWHSTQITPVCNNYDSFALPIKVWDTRVYKVSERSRLTLVSEHIARSQKSPTPPGVRLLIGWTVLSTFGTDVAKIGVPGGGMRRSWARRCILILYNVYKGGIQYKVLQCYKQWEYVYVFLCCGWLQIRIHNDHDQSVNRTFRAICFVV